MDTVIFVGLGVMGRPMAVNLQRAGFEVAATSRTQTSRDAARAAGVTVIDTIAALPRRADVVVTMLPDAPDVEAVLWGEGGLLAHLEAPATIVDMSTISPTAARRFAARAAEDGHAFVDAPVSGGEKGAVEGSLSIMAGGEAADIERLTPLFAAVGAATVHVGPTGSGQVVKAANQLIVAGNLQLLAEGIVLAEAHGVDPALALEVIGAGLGGSTTLARKRDALLSGDFTPGFRLALHHKDLGIVADAGRERGVALPATAVVAQLVQALVVRGDGDLDHAALLSLTRDLSRPRP
jgi:2-hydroxy-3-oxopropionate reductase